MVRAGSLRPARAALAVLLLGCALALWSSWPAALHVSDGGLSYDPARSSPLRAGALRSAWQLWQIAEACAAGRSPLEAHGVAEAGGDLLGSELPLLTGLLLAPVTRTLGPPAAVQLAGLAVPALAFAAAFLLARAAGARPLAAFGAGFAYAFSSASAHGALRGLEGASGPLAPLFFLCVLAWMGAGGGGARRRRRLSAAAAGLLLGLQLLAAAHVALLCALALPAVALAAPRLAHPAPEPAPRAGLARADGLAAFALALGATLALSAVLLLPVHGTFHVFASSARLPGLADVLLPPALHPLAIRPKEFDLFPGLVLSGLALFALWREPRSRRFLLAALLLAPTPWCGIAAPERAFGLVLLFVGVAAALGLERLLAGGYRRPVQALLVALAFELLTVEVPRTPAGTPEAVRRLAALEEGRAAGDETGAVAVVGHLGGPHAALLWQTVHRRPILFGAEPGLAELQRFGRRAPELFALLGGELGDGAALALELALLDVGHVLLPGADDARQATLAMELDELEGWERADTRDGLAWWYRSPSSSATAKH
jgi:hypothetical protein